MKSAAFNLAFKVHRGEMNFNEGLLQSQSEDAAEDFLDALNSLAGEVKYDKGQIGDLLNKANAGGGPAPDDDQPKQSANEKAIADLQEEIDQLRKKARDYEESRETVLGLLNSPDHFILAGLNSVMLLLVVAIVFMILVVWDAPIWIPIVIVLVGVVAAGFLMMKDMQVLNKQKAEAARKKERHEIELQQIEESLEKLNTKITEKQTTLEQLTAAQQAQMAAAQEAGATQPMSPPAP